MLMEEEPEGWESRNPGYCTTLIFLSSYRPGQPLPLHRVCCGGLLKEHCPIFWPAHPPHHCPFRPAGEGWLPFSVLFMGLEMGNDFPG